MSFEAVFGPGRHGQKPKPCPLKITDLHWEFGWAHSVIEAAQRRVVAHCASVVGQRHVWAEEIEITNDLYGALLEAGADESAVNSDAPFIDLPRVKAAVVREDIGLRNGQVAVRVTAAELSGYYEARYLVGGPGVLASEPRLIMAAHRRAW